MPFARILRSSALMGGAQAVTLATAFVRSKLIAVTIGPSGIGLLGVFNTFNSNVSTVAGWGLGTSAVRMIAGATPEDREGKVAAVRSLGRRLAALGAAAVVVAFLPAAYLAFDSQRYSLELLVAGLSVPCLVATMTWNSLLQAGGHVGSMARTQIAGSFLGLLAGAPAVFFLGAMGVALSILFASLATAYVTWRAAARLCPPGAVAPAAADRRELLQLGLILQVGGVVGAVSAYLVRALIVRSHGPDLAAGLADAGYYQAAFAITGSLPGVIFSAASSDFYPRVAAAADEGEARRITEKQVQASLLLATPILAALLVLGPWAVGFLYAKGFEPAATLLSWFVWAIFCNLIGWPFGFWVVARRSKRTVAAFQSLFGVATLVLALALVPIWGVRGAAIAYFGGSVAYLLLLLAVTRRFTGSWLGGETAAWAAAAGLLLGACATQVMTAPGFALVGLASAACLAIYLRAMRGQGGER